jgi:hypothetical protein
MTSLLLASYAALYMACKTWAPLSPLPPVQLEVARWFNIAMVFGLLYALASFYRRRVRQAEQALSQLARNLEASGAECPWNGPARLDDAAWVANRWCELLPIALGTRQKLMELEEPAARLRLVDGFLRGRGVVKG